MRCCAVPCRAVLACMMGCDGAEWKVALLYLLLVLKLTVMGQQAGAFALPCGRRLWQGVSLHVLLVSQLVLVHTTVELQVGCVAVLPCGRQCWCWCCRGGVVRCAGGRWAVLGAAPSACAHLCRLAGCICCSAAMLPVVLVPSCGALCWTQIDRLYCAVCGAGAAPCAGSGCSMPAGWVCCWQDVAAASGMLDRLSYCWPAALDGSASSVFFNCFCRW